MDGHYDNTNEQRLSDHQENGIGREDCGSVPSGLNPWAGMYLFLGFAKDSPAPGLSRPHLTYLTFRKLQGTPNVLY